MRRRDHLVLELRENLTFLRERGRTDETQGAYNESGALDCRAGHHRGSIFWPSAIGFTGALKNFSRRA
jgi:hypothetical protein